VCGVQDIFGDEAEEMMSVLPRRKHPANPKVEQWRLSEDYATMAVEKSKSHKTTATRKLNQPQADALMDAMDLTMNDETLMDMEKNFEDPKFKNMIEDSEFAELLPGKIKDDKSVAGSKGGKDGGKASLEDRMELQVLDVEP
jgi:hypothetical protein